MLAKHCKFSVGRSQLVSRVSAAIQAETADAHYAVCQMFRSLTGMDVVRKKTEYVNYSMIATGSQCSRLNAGFACFICVGTARTIVRHLPLRSSYAVAVG